MTKVDVWLIKQYFFGLFFVVLGILLSHEILFFFNSKLFLIFVLLSLFPFFLIYFGIKICMCPDKFKFKSFFVNFFVSIFFIFLTLLLCELILIFLLGNHFTLDSDYGWDIDSNFSTIIHVNDNEYTVNYSTFNYGFKKYDTPNMNKTRILVLGDSYTQAEEVNNGEEYFYYLESNSIQVFAKGVSGWGTLQEYLVFENFYDLIKPDIVIIQFTENDFFGNNFKVESQTLRHNDGNVRPYLENNKIVYRNPNFFNLPSYLLNFRLVRLINFVLKLHYLKYNLNELTIGSHMDDLYLTDNQNEIKILDYSVQTTRNIFKKFLEYDSEFYVFYVNEINSDFDFENYFLKSINNLNLTYIGLEKEEELFSEEFENYHTFSGHWNKKGHEVVGIALRKFLYNFSKKLK